MDLHRHLGTVHVGHCAFEGRLIARLARRLLADVNVMTVTEAAPAAATGDGAGGQPYR